MKITEFFDDEFIEYASYDNIRSLGSWIDGLKPTARKIVYTVGKQNITNLVKVSQLANTCSALTLYTHGENSMAGVVVGMAQDYPCSNNINLLEPKGFFGNRNDPESSAHRYIFTKKSATFDSIFLKEDREILIKQYFEGDEIEPKFFLPVIPLLLVNGSDGIGNGFAQKILPRDLKRIVTVIKNYLETAKLPSSIKPHYNGFEGTIERGEESNQWLITGKFERVDQTTIKVTELPIGYKLSTYKEVLDKLEDSGIIKSYTDASEDNTFAFFVKTDREFLKQDDGKIIDILRLQKKFTENFTCIGESNQIVEFKSEIEVLKAYCDFRIKYYQKRKAHLIELLTTDHKYISEKARFIKGVIDETIVVSKKSRQQVEDQLARDKFEPVNDKYDYLVNMPISSLTKEKYQELIESKNKKQGELKEVEQKSIKDFWLTDLNNI